MDTIPVIVESQAERTRDTLRGGGLSPVDRIKDISIETMQKSIVQLADGISKILENVKTVGDYGIKEVQVQVEITSEGGVALIGMAKAGIKGGMTITFSRNSGT